MAHSPRERTSTLADRITASLASLTRSERQAARTLLARYPTVGLESVGQFAERAGVSAPTVLRFIAKLGFGGYADFRRALREELEARSEYPLTRSSDGGGGQDGLGGRLASTVDDTLAMTQPEELERVVELLRDERRAVWLLGGDFTDSAARHLDFHLRKMRPRVRLLDHDLIRRADQLADMRRRDVLVTFDIRRYQPDTLATARVAAAAGVQVVLVTDQWMSGIAEVAAVVLRARVDGPSRWDSLVGVIALVEVLALAYDERVWAGARRRVELIEQHRAVLASAGAPDLGALSEYLRD